MGNEVKVKRKVIKSDTYETLKALYYAGKVKPSLNKMLTLLEKEPENIELTLLACKALVRTKNFVELGTYADAIIKMTPESGEGYYYKGVALHHTKGKEQEALKNINQALTFSPENVTYLKSKGSTHFMLYTDYNLPIEFAEKHRVKAETSLFKITELVAQKENPDYVDFLTTGEVNIMLSQNIEAKKYFIKAVNAFNAADEATQDMNIYKDLIKAQNACIKLLEKFTEG